MKARCSVPDSLPRRRRCISGYAGAVGVLMLVQVALVAWRGATESFVWDEVGHLASGVSHLELGRFDLYRVNPPLVRTIAAVGPLIAGYERNWAKYSERPHSRAEFRVGQDFVKANGPRSFWLLTLARWCTLWAPVLGGWVCWRWSFELFGPVAGLISLALWVFSPLVLANAALITPDCGAAASGVLAGYTFCRWLKKPSGHRALVAGLALGLALLTKTTWVLLFGLYPLAGVVWRSLAADTGSRKGGPDAVRYYGGLGLISLTGLLVLNYGYGFESTLRPLGEYAFVSQALAGDIPVVDGVSKKSGNRFSGTWAGRIPVPVPKNYLMGIDVQRSDFESWPRSYLRGQWRETGWWYYYLYGLAVKEPLATWLLLALAVASLFRLKSGWGLSPEEWILLSPALAVMVLVSSQTGLNQHVRYVLPALPFLFVWISRVGRWFEQRQRLMQAVIAGLVLWGAISSLRVFPHSITYFNEVAGGPAGGHRHLNSSNLDWGQGLLHLRKWYDTHPRARPFYLASGMPLVDPAIAGIDYRRVPTKSMLTAEGQNRVRLAPGWYAISVSYLISSRDDYRYFNNLVPEERVANVYWIFHVSEAEAREQNRNGFGDSGVAAAAPGRRYDRSAAGGAGGSGVLHGAFTPSRSSM